MKKRAGKGKSNLVCGACRDVAPIFRPSMRGREVGHIKHMYCAKCGVERPFIEHTADKIETMWALEAIDSSKELGLLTRMYNSNTGEFLTQEEQTEMLIGICKELEAEGLEWKVDLVCRMLVDRGYVVHVLQDFRPNRK